ncbi:hypothetical protein GWI33_014402 [Rhynchophorus ferrugineus]|uniref:Uncharacterized protein n=1 Tax=Rhynchophorus ferrugineus TaxID=354439 RepID=A0A834I661_RHYFE|nr:hypothetical protein GWI33_014402 [Rhynchophorus ferrugineus]
MLDMGRKLTKTSDVVDIISARILHPQLLLRRVMSTRLRRVYIQQNTYFQSCSTPYFPVMSTLFFVRPSYNSAITPRLTNIFLPLPVLVNTFVCLQLVSVILKKWPLENKTTSLSKSFRRHLKTPVSPAWQGRVEWRKSMQIGND